MVGIRVNEDGPGDVKRAYLDFWSEMAPHVVVAVCKSFIEANMTNPTHVEKKRRVEILKKLVDECRNDLKWSKQRIVAELPRLLRAKLIGTRDPRDERERKTVDKAGNVTTVYSVDPSATDTTPVASAATEQRFEKEFRENDDILVDPDDMAGPEHDEEHAVETSDEPFDPDEPDPS